MASDSKHSTERNVIEDAYSPELFRSLATIWQQKLSDHLQSVFGRTGNVLNWEQPENLVTAAEAFLHDGSSKPCGDLAEKFARLVDCSLKAGQNLHHPRYIGHQVPASLPTAALFDAVGTVTNQPMAIYEMGPWATAVEHAVVRAMQRIIGWDPDECAGLLTGGGSLANLTALLTARNVAFPDCWENGIPANARIFAHSDSHYCVVRSAGVLGIGTNRIGRVKLDAGRRMDPQHLDDLLKEAAGNGERVIAVSAAACATPIGAFDPLNEIADVCERHGVWLHVDAAHGGGALMSRAHRYRLDGIERADSLVWDAHKMMFVPALCAAVMYRKKAHRFEAFQQDAPYLFDPSDPGLAAFDFGMSTVECTKRTLGFGLWSTWAMFGESVFEEMVDHTFDIAQYFHGLLETADDFETLHVPECNIVVFRFLPESMRHATAADVDQLQHRIRTALIRSGQFYIVQTKLDGRTALRVAVMNPLTSRRDMEHLTEAIRDTAAKVI